MHFLKQQIDGLWLVTPERLEDCRGSFARTFCTDEFEAHGLVADFRQHSLSISARQHTLRGLHFQKSPHQEVKLVTCVRGAIWDVAVDLRVGSPSYLQWASAVLTAENGAQFYIPTGFAHGFLSLCDDVAVGYMISERYAPDSASGLRFDDVAIAVAWPAAPAVISERDLGWPELPLPA